MSENVELSDSNIKKKDFKIKDTNQGAPKESNHAMGVLCILLAAVGFSLMTFFVRVSGDLPTMQKVFFRNAVAAVIAFYILVRTPEKFKMKKGSLPGILLRCVFGTSGMICNFWAIDRLGIADANMLNKLSPFFAIIMSIFILKEKPNKFEIGSVLVAFTGALFIIKPSAGIASIPALVGLYGGFGAGAAYTFVRMLGKKGERTPIIVMWFSAFSSLIALPFLIFDYHPMSTRQLLCLIAAGCGAALGQMCITKAYTYAPAKEISVFDYAQVVFAAALGTIFLDEIPDIYSIIGYIIIIGTALVKWFVGLRLDKQKTVSA
ncbi:MAG: DMT family transporter [Lachnospiraceae bacterium]|nr:DMT family transporter [Lachnospiraceae bacterium]